MKLFRRAASVFLAVLLAASAAAPVFAQEAEETAGEESAIVETLSGETLQEEAEDSAETQEISSETVSESDENSTEETQEQAGSETETVEEASDAPSEASAEAEVQIQEEPVSIGEACISPIEDQVYTGEALEPAVTVTVDGTLLEAGTDYTVIYENNLNAGTALVTVTGCGAYTGSAGMEFRILQAENSITASSVKLTASKTKVQTVGLNASALSGDISYASDQSAVKVDGSGTVTVAKGFCGAATLTLTAGGGNYKTVTDTLVVKVCPETVPVDRIIFVSAGSVRINWMQNDLATGYQIQYALKSDFSDRKTITVRDNATLVSTISGLTDGNLYYVRIRAYTKNGAVNVYSPWNSISFRLKVALGIDVSYWNGTIDWTKVAATGVTFAMIRAGYGKGTQDSKFAANAAGAQAAGLATGADWFSYATTVAEAEKEADACYEVIKNAGIGLPVFYDFEYDSVRYAAQKGVTVSPTLATDLAIAFMNRMLSKGVETGIYSNLDYMNRYFDYSRISDYPLWYAHWGTVNPTYKSEYWQYSSTGSVSGISGNVDMNQSNLLYASDERYHVAGITLSKSSATVNRTKTLKLTALVRPGTAINKTVSWKSSKSSVASVSANGVVTANKVGTTVITATTEEGGLTASCKVTVVPKVTEIRVDPSAKTLYVTRSFTVTPTVDWGDDAEEKITWSSSNTKVAKVSSSGKVKAVGKGTAVITAATPDGKKASCTVTARIKQTKISLSATSKSLYSGKSFTITPTISWAYNVDKTWKWSSSNTKVAKVSSGGKVTAVGKGSCTITLTTSDGKTASCRVTVKIPASSVKLSASSKKLTPGKTAQLKAAVYPTSASNRKVTWSSSNTKVARVSSGGLVTATGKGSCTITAKTHNGKTAKCRITVTETLTRYKTRDALNYRSGPGTGYASKGVLKKGTKVYVVRGYSKTVNGYKWYMIKRSGSYYYVAAKYLKKI